MRFYSTSSASTNLFFFSFYAWLFWFQLGLDRNVWNALLTMKKIIYPEKGSHIAMWQWTMIYSGSSDHPDSACPMILDQKGYWLCSAPSSLQLPGSQAHLCRVLVQLPLQMTRRWQLHLVLHLVPPYDSDMVCHWLLRKSPPSTCRARESVAPMIAINSTSVEPTFTQLESSINNLHNPIMIDTENGIFNV